MISTVKLIADSGATKTEWRLLNGEMEQEIFTQGISPYLMDTPVITEMLQKELIPVIATKEVNAIYYYGTGCADKENVKRIKTSLLQLFPEATIAVDTDIMAAARALCGNSKGIACILGTGSNSCYFDGNSIQKNNPALGYVLGDEGSGAYLGKKVLQYFLYHTFDEFLMEQFNQRFNTTPAEIVANVYKKPLANRYIASFVVFLAENRGHYMIENIIEDGLNDFILNHLYKYTETWTLPVHFTGGVAFGFRDILKELCQSYEIEMGTVLAKPMDGLLHFHK